MSSALIIWLGCSLGLFLADILGMLFRLSVKEQDTGRATQYSRLRHLLCIRRLHTVSGTEAHQYRCPFHPGTADTDRRNDCFCPKFLISLFLKKEKKNKLKPIIIICTTFFLPSFFFLIYLKKKTLSFLLFIPLTYLYEVLEFKKNNIIFIEQCIYICPLHFTVKK